MKVQIWAKSIIDGIMHIVCGGLMPFLECSNQWLKGTATLMITMFDMKDLNN